MSNQPASIQRSFRLSPRTLELLKNAAAETGESRNALAERLLGEALRVQAHPLIRFHDGAAGRWQPILFGTRLYIYQIISTLRASDNDLEEAAAYLSLTPRQVRAALEYYTDFREEVDADAAAAERIEKVQRARWERAQRALA